jgi:hypothetical protein
MDTRMTLQIAQEHIADLHRAAAAQRRIPELVEVRTPTSVIALRLAGPDEAAELAHLAALDSTRRLRGDALVALVDGKLVAAVSLVDGRMIADPFTPTAEARALLRTRAVQLTPTPRSRRRRFPRFRLRFA